MCIRDRRRTSEPTQAVLLLMSALAAQPPAPVRARVVDGVSPWRSCPGESSVGCRSVRRSFLEASYYSYADEERLFKLLLSGALSCWSCLAVRACRAPEGDAATTVDPSSAHQLLHQVPPPSPY